MIRGNKYKKIEGNQNLKYKFIVYLVEIFNSLVITFDQESIFILINKPHLNGTFFSSERI